VEAPKETDAIESVPGAKDDPEKRAAFLQHAARPSGLLARGKAVEGLKTLGEVADWIVTASGAPLVFMEWSTKCPTSRGYEERLLGIIERTGARLYLLASNQVGETDAEVKDYVEAAEIPFPVLLDREQVACNCLGGKRTPHVFLLDAKNALRYQGAIDNDPGEEKEPAQRAHWLEDAIRSLVEAREVNVLMTSPKG
jgi:hypothetical protein